MQTSEHVPPTPLGSEALALSLAALCLSAWDMRGVMAHSASFAGSVVAATAVTSWAAIFAAASGPLLLRAWLRARPSRASFVFGLGALDATLVLTLALFVQGYATLRPTRLQLVLAIAAGSMGGGLLAVLCRRRPVLVRPAALAWILLACMLMSRVVSLREKEILRLALDGILLAALSSLWLPSLPVVRVRHRVVALLCVTLLGSVLFIVRASHDVRSAVLQYAPHTQAWLLPFRALRLPPAPTQRALGPALCQAPPLRLPYAASALSGTQAKADVLMLSIDALRWDHAFALPQLFAALGPHVRFTRAAAPAPNTRFAIGSILRGVPVRQVPVDSRGAFKKGKGELPPTLADLLKPKGYRTVQIPTSRFFDPRTGMTRGFEVVLPRGQPVFATGNDRRPAPAASEGALKAALEVAEHTPLPLLLWTHVMDSHGPYLWKGGKGPSSREGQLHALRDLDAPLAKFVRDYRRARKGRRLIIGLFGDHGEEFAEHGSGRHGTSAYAEVARVAFAIAFDNAPRVQVGGPVSTASLAPTLLDLLGLSAPSFTLPSLLSCIEDRARCPLLAETQQVAPSGFIGYTAARYRLLYHPRADVTLLFDADADRYEQHDLHSQLAYAPVLAQMRELARAYDATYCQAEANQAAADALE